MDGEGQGVGCGVFCKLFFFKQKTAYEMLRGLVGSEMYMRARSDLWSPPWSAGHPGDHLPHTVILPVLVPRVPQGSRAPVLVE
mgnify:CR=1 FL=1